MAQYSAKLALFEQITNYWLQSTELVSDEDYTGAMGTLLQQF
ncbi:MAG: hypothetical protein RM021_015485 [Nostoc sp. EkiNYC01]|nr:hypothetical protein [Nostoc sp. EkiNYC01]